MKNLKTFLATIALLLCCGSASAHDFEVDGIYYNITSSSDLTAEVTYRGSSSKDYSNEYSGSVVIPESVTYNSKTYCVTSIGHFAFNGCSRLTSLTIPNSVTSIGMSAFSGTAWYNNQSDGLIYAGKVAYSYRGTMPQHTHIELAEGTLGIAGSIFYDCDGLTSVTIPNSVISIGDNAFYDCDALTSVTIPNSVTSIGYEAFSSCDGLTSVTIGNCVINIDDKAFYNCSSLTSITIPNSVISIGEYAFDGTKWYNMQPGNIVYTGKVAYKYRGTMEAGTHIKLKDGTLGIAGGAFRDCSNLSSIYLTNSVTSIGDNAFYGCRRLTSVTIPNSVTSIGNYAFQYCSSLTSVTIHDGVTSIGSSAFSKCSSLTSVTIPNSVTSIGDGAFHDCTSLTSVTIPNSVTSIGNSAFSYCSSLISVTIPNSVTSIGYDTFYDCSNLTSITIGSSVTSIDDRAFYNCDGLTSVNILDIAAWCNIKFSNYSSNPLYYAKHLYMNGKEITELTIPDGVTSIGEYAFYGCSGLTSVAIGNGVTSIGEDAFSGCSGLTSVTIGSSVTSIGNHAFNGCNNLQTIASHAIPPPSIGTNTFSSSICDEVILYVPNGFKPVYETVSGWENFKNIIEKDFGNDASQEEVISFADSKVKKICVANWDTNGDGELSTVEAASIESVSNVFEGNKEIKSFNEFSYFTGLKEIEDKAFYCCENLNTIILPDNVNCIGEYAFGYCPSLYSLTIPNNVVKIKKNAFINCSSLTSVSIPEGVESIEECVFFHCSGLINVVIPNTVKSIGEQSFSGCKSLTSINIPDGVTSIGNSAFSHCSNLSNIYIPENVYFIGGPLFVNCPMLTSIYVSEKNPYYDSRENCNAIIETATNTLIGSCSRTVIPDGVTKIANYAFSDCSNLTSLVIPKSVIEIDINAFYNSENFFDITTLAVKEGNPVYDSRNNCNAIIATATNTLVRGCYKTVIPENIETIGTYAFDGCKKLYSIVLPSSVTRINKGAFSSCYDMESFYAMSSTPPIVSDDYQFTKLSAKLYVPKGCKSAYESASGWNEFEEIIEKDYDYDVSQEELISFADSIVKEICVSNWDTNGDGELSYAEAYAVKSLGMLFSGKDIRSFYELKYFKGLKDISMMAFQNCKNLTFVNIPDSVTIIDFFAFTNCSSLTSINIPKNVTNIANSAFWGCGAIDSLTVDSSNINYDSRDNCNAIIETRTNQLIRGCNETIIPNSVTCIGNKAFSDCNNLNTITIPSNVVSIGSFAFMNCCIKSMTSLATVPPTLVNGVFTNDLSEGSILYVPSGCKSAYESTAGWNEFDQIIELGQYFEYDNYFMIFDTTFYSNKSLMMPVGMFNKNNITAFQCDVYLPEGITLQTYRGKYDITLDENRMDDHNVTYALQEDGSIRIFVASLTNSVFAGDCGNLFYLNLKADEEFNGEGTISIKNIIVSDSDGERYDLVDVKANITIFPYILGDVNGDGDIVVNDIVYTINYILGENNEDFIFEAADINGDGEIVVDDVVKIINIILGVNTTSEAPMHRAVQATNKFYINDFNIKAGESKVLAIQLESNSVGSAPNQLNYVAFQFDIYLPEGLKVDMKRGKYNFALTEARKDDHTLTFADQADGAIRVIGASLSNAYFWETSGDFVTFSVTAEEDFAGAKALYLKNIKFSTKTGERSDLDDVTVNINNDASGIENISSESGQNGNVYNFQGQKLREDGNTNSLPHGLYIINGKKVVKN